MLLAIDIGNTNTHIGIFNGHSRLVATETIAHEQIRKLVKSFRPCLGIVSAVRYILLSSTRPPVEAAVRKWVKTVFCSDVRVLKAGRDFKIPIANPADKGGTPRLRPRTGGGQALRLRRTRYPGRVGPDRLLCAYAAYRLFRKPLIVVSFGTAITFNVVSVRGEYRPIKGATNGCRYRRRCGPAQTTDSTD
ncbi:MAG: type III pantothenate kinase [Planctomycetes bacterium]|nr:type III pantothenate kinase [Planctomycetota bacterium]